jgi:sugar/nucleoside kinase (ribokinase family)
MILAIGELLVDLVTTEVVNDLSESNMLQIKSGGSCANFASFCQKQDIPLQLIAAVGKDGLGKKILASLEEKNIDTSHIIQHKYFETSMIVVAKSFDTPDFVPYRKADYHIAAIPENLVGDCSIIHTTAFALSKQPAQTNILNAFFCASEWGKKISVDWNYALKIWGHDNNAQEIFEKIISMKPLLKVSMDDVDRFWGASSNIETAKKILEKYDTEVTCLTCGEDGVWYRIHDSPWKYKPVLPANVIDVTGAGDAFWSGFISSYYKGNNPDECVDNALFFAMQRLEQKI